jgi:hypothetical protein
MRELSNREGNRYRPVQLSALRFVLAPLPETPLRIGFVSGKGAKSTRKAQSKYQFIFHERANLNTMDF